MIDSFQVLHFEIHKIYHQPLLKFVSLIFLFFGRFESLYSNAANQRGRSVADFLENITTQDLQLRLLRLMREQGTSRWLHHHQPIEEKVALRDH